MPTHAEDLAIALELAQVGAEVAMSYYRKDPSAERKRDGTWVTEADRAAEKAIRRRVAELRPDDDVLGEEEGLASVGGGSTRGRTWVIDPIDGTNNYIAGIPIWATLVGLRIGDDAVVGVAHAPALGETYDGALGAGARLNGIPIAVDPIESLEDATIVHASLRSFEEERFSALLKALAHRAARTRGFGDFWGHVLVARGAAHVMVEPRLAPWDVIPLVPIVAEAGGRITHLDGSDWRVEGSCLTTCGTLHEEVVSLARTTGAA